jgi:hypothetical protein
LDLPALGYAMNESVSTLRQRMGRFAHYWFPNFWFSFFPGLILLGLMIGFLLFFGQLQWPGLHWDAALFATPVLRVASEGEWKFGSYTEWLITKPSRLYDFHGFLHVILFGGLLKAASWKAQFFWISLFNVITVLAYVFLFDRALRRNGVQSFFLAVFFSFVPAVMLLGIQGRPEHLQLLLVAIPLLFWEITANGKLALRASYVIAGLMFIASPLSGLAYGVLILLALLVQSQGSRRPLPIIREILVLFLVASLTATLTAEIFTPMSIFSWLKSMLGEAVGVKDFEGKLSQFYELRLGLSMIVPFWNLLVVFCVFIAFVFLLERRQFFAVGIGVLAFLYFNKKMADYGYICFLPALLVLAVDWSRVSRGQLLIGLRYRWILAIVAFVASAYAIVFVQYALFSLALQSDHHNLDVSRSRLDGLVGEYRSNSSHIAVGYPAVRTPSFVVLGDGGDRFIDLPFKLYPEGPHPWIKDYESSTGNRVKFYVLPLPPQYGVKDAPASIFVGNRRFNRIFLDRPLSENSFTRFVKLDRLANAYHMAVFREAQGSEVVSLTASPSLHPQQVPGR